MKYSVIAKKYLEELDRKDPSIQHKIITWGNLEMMEDLFKLFGGDREDIINKTNNIGHHFRFKFVMDRLDRESKKKNAIFEKGFIRYNGIINRPTRCFILKENDCNNIECEPPFGGKTDCEFYKNGVCKVV